jgi:hypothetical protein
MALGVRLLIWAVALSLLALTATAADEGAPPDSDSDLAKKTQNPIANLISVPFQNNTSYNFGPRDRTQNVLNIQPVIPIDVNEDWNVITRSIIPIVSTPSGTRGQNRQNGIGDITFTAFLSPKKALGDWLIFGAGPILNIPTASDDRLGSDLWGAGLSAVGLTMQGPMVAGAIVSNVWSLEGEDFSAFLFQYFVNYNFPGGWYLSSSPIMTADWEAKNDDWLIPVGGGFGKVHRFGKLPVNISFQAFYNVEQNAAGADWSTRFQVQFLFPK